MQFLHSSVTPRTRTEIGPVFDWVPPLSRLAERYRFRSLISTSELRELARIYRRKRTKIGAIYHRINDSRNSRKYIFALCRLHSVQVHSMRYDIIPLDGNQSREMLTHEWFTNCEGLKKRNKF